MKIKAVVFDMDGLMIDSERVVQKSWGIVGRRMGYPNMEEDIYFTLGLNQKGRENYLKGKYGANFPFTQFLDAYRLEYNQYREQYGIPPKKGLYELLNALKKWNIQMAVATSTSRESAMRNIESLGILEYFNVFVCGDMVKESKPDPEIYLSACSKLGVMPSQAVALEDSVNGIKSAYAAGMIPVMIPDLIRDTSAVDDMLATRKDDLLEAAKWIEINL